MTNIQLFNNPKFWEIRVVEIDGKPFFVANDVASALGYSSPKDAITRHCKGATFHRLTDNQGFIRDTKVISQGDIYRLAAKSELPGAEEFESWIFDEILPSISKHGAYMTAETIEKTLLSPDFIIKLATNLKEEQQKRIALECEVGRKEEIIELQHETINELAPKAEYTDKVLSSQDAMTITQIAKDYGMSGQALNKKLHDLGIQYKVNEQWVLYQKYQDKGYTKSNTYTETIDGVTKTYISTTWTQKGRQFIDSLVRVKVTA